MKSIFPRDPERFTIWEDDKKILIETYDSIDPVSGYPCRRARKVTGELSAIQREWLEKVDKK